MQLQNKSPYSASMTGCGFMLEEMNRILPLLMDPASDTLLKKEVVENSYLMINTENTRKRAVVELVKRYQSVPQEFWKEYLSVSKEAQCVAMYFVNLKCYRLFFDLHLNLVLKKWHSIRQTLTRTDVLMEINAIATQDDFVDSWSDNTKIKVASAFLSFLRKVKFLEPNGEQLKPISLTDEEFAFYLKIRENWFLEACLLQPYEIERITKVLV